MIGPVSPFLLSQILAAGAFAVGFGAFQFERNRNVFLALVASAIFTSCHFFLLGRPEAGGLMLVVASRLAGSPVGALMEVAFLTSNVVGYWRYYHRR